MLGLVALPSLLVSPHPLTGRAVLQQRLEPLDILHSLGEDVDFGHLLNGRRSGNMSLQHLKSVVNSLDSVPLPGIPPGDLHVLGRRDGVAVDRVDRHQLRSRSHFGHFSH